jgi:hypothetical protein
MDVVRVDDVQRLTFFRDTEEMVQGFSPRITVPGFGTFTTISIEFRYRNTVDTNGQQALKVVPPALSLYLKCVRFQASRFKGLGLIYLAILRWSRCTPSLRTGNV